MEDKKQITFSISQFILNDSSFNINDFSSIKEETIYPNHIGSDLVSVDIIKKGIYYERFISFYFKLHEKYPYSDKVLTEKDGEVEEKDNPRPSCDIELKDVFFILLDTKYQRIYLSNRQKGSHFSDFLSKNNIKNSIIKPIIQEYDFIKRIRSIKEITFTVENNNLARQSGVLSKNLSEDIYGYQADEATLSLRYKKNKTIDKIKDKISNIIDNKGLYKNLTIIGRDGSEFEKVFNLEGVTSRISVRAHLLTDTREINVEDMIKSLIITIIKNDETK